MVSGLIKVYEISWEGQCKGCTRKAGKEAGKLFWPASPTTVQLCSSKQVPLPQHLPSLRATYGEGRYRNRIGRPEITQDTGKGSRRSKRLARSSRAQSTTRRLRRRKSTSLVSRPQRERSPAFRPDTCLTRTFLLHVLRPP